MIKRTRKVHAGFEEMMILRKRMDYVDWHHLPKLFQKWQYFYEKDGKKMDCVQFASDMYDGMDFEIYGAIEDVERFSSLEEAEKRIEEVLGDKIER